MKWVFMRALQVLLQKRLNIWTSTHVKPSEVRETSEINFLDFIFIFSVKFKPNWDSYRVKKINPKSKNEWFAVFYVKLQFLFSGKYRVIYDRVRNRKNYFEIAAFLNFEWGTSREGNSKHKQTHLSCCEV